MTSAYKKGNQYENEVKKILEKDGYKVEGQHRRVMFIGSKRIMVGRDIFGCDLIAKKSGWPVKWVQVSTVNQKSAKFKQIAKDFIHSSYGEEVEFWGRIVGKSKFRVFKYPSGEEIDVKKF